MATMEAGGKKHIVPFHVQTAVEFWPYLGRHYSHHRWIGGHDFYVRFLWFGVQFKWGY